MMKVVGEEGTYIDDFVLYLKSEFLDATYLQQDAYHEVDGATSADRQKYVFGKITNILRTNMNFKDKAAARTFFQNLTQATKDWNRLVEKSDEYKQSVKQIKQMLAKVTVHE